MIIYKGTKLPMSFLSKLQFEFPNRRLYFFMECFLYNVDCTVAYFLYLALKVDKQLLEGSVSKKTILARMEGKMPLYT